MESIDELITYDVSDFFSLKPNLNYIYIYKYPNDI